MFFFKRTFFFLFENQASNVTRTFMQIERERKKKVFRDRYTLGFLPFRLLITHNGPRHEHHLAGTKSNDRQKRKRTKRKTDTYVDVLKMYVTHVDVIGQVLLMTDGRRRAIVLGVIIMTNFFGSAGRRSVVQVFQVGAVIPRPMMAVRRHGAAQRSPT